MPEVILAGPAGRLEGFYHGNERADSPLAIVLHAHPRGGGTMHDPIVTRLFDLYKARGFSVLRFNYRGVGRSQGEFEHGLGELSDAATALDWMQSLPQNQAASFCWVAGFQFGAWIGMQLLMRRPEIKGFVSVTPPMNLYDFSFLAPCPASGLVINGSRDTVVPPSEIQRQVGKIRTQKGMTITHQVIEGANHFFTEHLDPLEKHCSDYLDVRLPEL